MKPHGRLVQNHSPHVQGLIPVLKTLAQVPGISTVTPGRIKNGGKGCSLRLRVTVPVLGGYRLIARAGSSTQEVFVLTTLPKAALQAVLDDLVRGT